LEEADAHAGDFDGIYGINGMFRIGLIRLRGLEGRRILDMSYMRHMKKFQVLSLIFMSFMFLLSKSSP
jgi:hypothetical protein